MALHKDLSLTNRLISMLPSLERGLLLEHSELVELKLHTVLMEAGQSPDHAYFPVDSFVSLIRHVEDSPDMEVALIGNEGMFNISLVLGVPESPFTGLVQGAGRAFRIHRRALGMRRAEDARLREVLYRYIHIRSSHLSQQAACMNYHSVEQKLARALLMTRDRAHASELFLTHESLALMMGVRRESVSQAARLFQNRGLVSYTRGYVMLLDEAGLESVSCKCYETDLKVYEQTMSALTHTGEKLEADRQQSMVLC